MRSRGGDDQPRPHTRRFGSTPESAAPPPHQPDSTTDDGEPGRVSNSPPPLRHPIKAEQEPACGENREPYRSRLKPSPFAVLLAPSCSAAAERRWRRTGAPTGTACSSGVSPTATAPTSRALSGLLLASPDPMLLPPFCACPRPVPKP